jgi:hypothetical protein
MVEVNDVILVASVETRILVEKEVLLGTVVKKCLLTLNESVASDKAELVRSNVTQASVGGLV